MDGMKGTWVASRYAIEPRRLDAMRRAGELVAFRRDGDWLYPAWQFDGRGPLPALREVAAEARRLGVGPDELVRLLESHSGLTGKRHLRDSLVDGDLEHVLGILRSRARSA
jgi:hypothetical protein